MYMSYNCQYSLFNLLCIFSYIVNVILYGISLSGEAKKQKFSHMYLTFVALVRN